MIILNKSRKALCELRELLPCLYDVGLSQAWVALILGIALIYGKIIHIIAYSSVSNVYNRGFQGIKTMLDKNKKLGHS
jgi:uncharacterized membrane protein YecN with MAPEG domain